MYPETVETGHDYAVVAPSLISRWPGDRVKTDRHDALTLGRQHRSNEEREATRDLTPAREDVQAMQIMTRQRLGAFLLCHGAGIRYPHPSRWGAVDRCHINLGSGRFVGRSCGGHRQTVTIVSSVGIPPAGIAIILGVDRLLDMCRIAVASREIWLAVSPSITGTAVFLAKNRPRTYSRPDKSRPRARGRRRHHR